MRYVLRRAFSASNCSHLTGGCKKRLQVKWSDSFCYATRDAKGKEHAQCASSCIKAGVPVRF